MERIFDFNSQFEEMMQTHGLADVVILGHINPDGDSVGSVLGLAHYIKDLYPQYRIYPYLTDNIDKGPMKIVKEESIFHPFQMPDTEIFGVVICDTATKARISGREIYERAVASIVIDHHISNEGYGDINFTREAESCAENLCSILDLEKWSKISGKKSVYPDAINYLYLGIVHDTFGFSRATGETMEIAAKLIYMGVDHKRVYATLQNDTLRSVKTESVLYSKVDTVDGGNIAYIFINRDTADKYGITYEDIHPVSSRLKECEDVRMGFTMYEEKKDLWRCSFRSDSKWLDVNELAGGFGGGGHPGAAGLKITAEDGKKLLRDILEKADKLIKRDF